MTATPLNQVLNVINFKTRDFDGCINIDYVNKVVNLPQLNYAPDAPDYVIGLLNIAGTIIPVMDLSALLRVSEPVRYTINTPIIICHNKQGRKFGLIVKEVYDIAVIGNSMMQKTTAAANKSLVSCAVKFNDHISLLIDVENIEDGVIDI